MAKQLKIDLIEPRDLPQFQRALLAWFQGNKRDLPWRRTSDPYRIWISEIMLQQTRVAAVIPYYERFVAKFPTLRHLARARISAVLTSWSGLGYYSRARNLQRTAKVLVAQHDGQFPRDVQTALELPGIGSYTAAAILSIAYGEPLAVLDGNVARVLTRLGAMRGNFQESMIRRKLESAAVALLAFNAPGDWNQSMMELGATLCTPVAPACEQCPINRWCRAHRLGIAEKLPAARRKSRVVNIDIMAAVFLDSRGRTLLVRHRDGSGALFSGLWQFPAVETKRVSEAALRRQLLNTIQRTAAVPNSISSLTPARHTVTFRNIRLHPFLIRVPKLPLLSGARTARLGSLDSGALPISNATRKIVRVALKSI